MSEDAATFTFVDEGRMADPAQLATFLKENAERAVAIDVLDAPLITSLHYQVYLASAAERAGKEAPITFTNANDQFNTCLTLLGGQHETLCG